MKVQNLNRRLIGHTINEFSVASHHDCARECTSLMFHMMSGIPRISTYFVTNDPAVPFVHNFEKLSPGKQFQIEGIPFPNPTRFTIYIQKGGEFEPYKVAFDFDVRFEFYESQNVIVRNHKQGKWGKEEKNIPIFKFKPSVPFRLRILFVKGAFMVEVDNEHYIEFRLRHSTIDNINTLRIDGDVQLTKVMVQG